MNQTKLEIHATKELLKQWNCFDNLTKNEKERIEESLRFIAETAVREYKQKINELKIEL